MRQIRIIIKWNLSTLDLKKSTGKRDNFTDRSVCLIISIRSSKQKAKRYKSFRYLVTLMFCLKRLSRKIRDWNRASTLKERNTCKLCLINWSMTLTSISSTWLWIIRKYSNLKYSPRIITAPKNKRLTESWLSTKSTTREATTISRKELRKLSWRSRSERIR